MQPTISPMPTRPIALRAAAIAGSLVLALAVAAYGLMGTLASPYLEPLAPSGEDEVVRGLYLTRRALAQPDRLLLLGSSELTFQDQYHAVRLFATRPTGFATWVIGSGYRQSIHNLLLLGALGPELKGKRLVLFISPTWFTPQIEPRAYRKNYAPLHAYGFLFDQGLSPALKRDAAQRLLSLGEPATADPLLRNQLTGLARGGWRGRLQYALGWPIARLTYAQFQLSDRYGILRLVRVKRILPVPAQSLPAPIDWSALMAKATAEAQARTSGNPFGMADEFYTKQIAPRLNEAAGSARNERWVTSTEFDDLALVLRLLQEVGAEPLFISLPVLGAYQDFKGHAEADRAAYYARVRQQIAAAGFPVADLSGYEYTPGFHRDPWHQAWKGSVTIAEVIDRFYHGLAPTPRP